MTEADSIAKLEIDIGCAEILRVIVRLAVPSAKIDLLPELRAVMLAVSQLVEANPK
jgi:hypothetical protein